MALITFPVDGEHLGDILIGIRGNASDSTDFSSYEVEYGEGTAPTVWTLLTNSITPVDPEDTLAATDL